MLQQQCKCSFSSRDLFLDLIDGRCVHIRVRVQMISRLKAGAGPLLKDLPAHWNAKSINALLNDKPP